MNRIGRPRNTSGSLYSRRDSRVWWMSYRDHNGKFRQESTGERERGEAEKVLRKRLVARDEGLPPSAAPDGGITFNQWADWFLEKRSQPPFRSESNHQLNLSVLKFLRPRFGETETGGHHAGGDRSVPDEPIEHRQTGAHQVGAATSRPAQTGHRASGVSHPAMHSERGGEEAAAGGQSVQRGGVSSPIGGHDAQAILSDRLGAGPAGSLCSAVSAQHHRDHGGDGAAALSGVDSDAKGTGGLWRTGSCICRIPRR